MSQSRLCPPRRARKVPAVPFRRGAAACPAPGPADSCQREHGASIPPARNPAEMGSHPEMGEMESYKVMLNGPAPWGFRLQGGKDFSMPLSISRLTPGGKAAQAGVGVGDWVLYIDGESTGTMTHIEAQNRIRACGDRLCLTLSRAQNHLGKPQKDSLPCSEPPKYNFAPSTALNKTARPFGASSPPNPRPGLVTKPVTYVPLAPACTPQHNGKPQEHPSSPKYDPSKLHLIEDSEDWQPRNTSTQSRSFLKLAQLTGTDSFEDHEDEPVRKPRGPRVSFWGTEEEWQSMHPPGTPACDPGKLRLMEDAEDWQPRTGTSQSRSFRKLARLTGTDGLEDHEDEPVRKPRDARGSFCGTEDQRQPPSHTEPPTAPACDPGKLRLMEDAEDWQPRTGTSQSRSFHKLARLTGTDGRFEDHEDEPVRKPRDARGSFSGTEEQWQPPPHVEPPTTPACDPGKLRLFEDAEDWQPRTGTSQSRSFRKLARLTGTDGLEDHEDEPVRKPRSPQVLFCGTEEPRQPPQPLEPPTTPACDPGKLRLFEDAEDWQPRTGTSQSRSFRKLARLTGTDGLEDDDVFIKKPSQVSVPDPSPGAAMKTEPGLAPRTPAATPGPTSRPPWAVDPSFAERYAPDKTSTVLSKHSQPATPTPMQNRSSIVQAAQQAPESPGRTPLCYKCNKIIRGRYLVALGHYYHPEEFTCCQCRKVLDEGGFFEEKGSIFCPKCYDTRYAPSCAKCKKKITGEVMHALKMTWHVQCFTCAACKTPIRNRAFYMEEGQPYCERDYEKMFGTKCRGCDFKIDAGDRFLEALGFSWHDTCFVCAICQTNLEGKTFYSKKDKPLCKSHAFSHV
ncbi:PDZ and LIM domain protein 7 isoform X48 [Gallus gallus]|uniref:PDZ and LIM domain protein 7 isoform X48 n=1 Tax=Gallus gallus TaxID=9031 RepID=UPI001F02F0A8|nr:PDZ and LIM domain protein 7 isoform X48 [Gallus gallus]